MIWLLLAGAGFAVSCIAYAAIVIVGEWRRRLVDFDRVYREFTAGPESVTSIRTLVESEDWGDWDKAFTEETA